jgi:hypothetical protein
VFAHKLGLVVGAAEMRLLFFEKNKNKKIKKIVSLCGVSHQKKVAKPIRRERE